MKIDILMCKNIYTMLFPGGWEAKFDCKLKLSQSFIFLIRWF